VKITINEKTCEENGLELDELLAILLVKTSTDIPRLFRSLEEKQVLVKDMFGCYMVTQRWDDVASTILLDSDKNHQSPERLENLALKMMELFPKEKKSGTCYYFRGNKKDNILRLKKFFKLYGKYTDDQILDATKRYVESFNGNYSYMRILKYFIWKDEVKTDSEGKGYIDETSDLANWIENKDQVNHSSDWTSNII
jgi:hypothetical protein